jgi:Skp family chaperone for outer membrane proteins
LAALWSAKFKENNKVNRRFAFRTAALLAVSLLGTVAIQAQGTAPGSAASGKVGVVDVRQAIVATAEGKQASAELQSQFAARQSELEGINKQISDIRQKLSLGDKLSPDEGARLQRQGEVLTHQLQRKQDEYQEDVNAAQADVVDRIGRKMIDVLDRYSRENGFVIVFDSSAQNSPVLYKSTQIDVTQDIIRLYDQAYPVKSGALTTTPKPAAAKPATAPPASKPATTPPGKP